MCFACWRGDYAGATELAPASARVVELRDAIYRVSPVGGLLHIVLDDWNIEDEHLDYCLALDDLTEDERECALLLRAMTVAERAATLAVAEGYTDETLL